MTTRLTKKDLVKDIRELLNDLNLENVYFDGIKVTRSRVGNNPIYSKNVGFWTLFHIRSYMLTNKEVLKKC